MECAMDGRKVYSFVTEKNASRGKDERGEERSTHYRYPHAVTYTADTRVCTLFLSPSRARARDEREGGGERAHLRSSQERRMPIIGNGQPRLGHFRAA